MNGLGDWDLTGLAENYSAPGWIPVYEHGAMASAIYQEGGFGSEVMMAKAVDGCLWMELRALIDICATLGDCVFATADGFPYVAVRDPWAPIEEAVDRNAALPAPGYRSLLRLLLETGAMRRIA
ncbi:MAG: hypothetical protein ACKOQ3_15170 [Novosphingobium sp.]